MLICSTGETNVVYEIITFANFDVSLYKVEFMIFSFSTIPNTA